VSVRERNKFTRESVDPELRLIIDSKVVVTEKLSVAEAWFVLMSCQLTYTHPNLGASLKDRYVALGRRMQELLRPHVSAWFAEFMEAGWNRGYDE
jgi:hypothetical protein